LTIIFLLAVVTLQPFAIYASSPQTIFFLCLSRLPDSHDDCGLLSAIESLDGSPDQHNFSMSGRAVEAAGDVNTLLLTRLERLRWQPAGSEFFPRRALTARKLADAAQLSSLATKLRKAVDCRVAKENMVYAGASASREACCSLHAQTRMSGINLNGNEILKDPQMPSARYLQLNNALCRRTAGSRRQHCAFCGTPLLCEKHRALGVISSQDIVKAVYETVSAIAVDGH